MQISNLEPEYRMHTHRGNRLCALMLVFLLGMMSYFAGSAAIGCTRPGFSDFAGRSSSLLYAINTQEEHEVIGHGRECGRRNHRIHRPDHPEQREAELARLGLRTPAVALLMPARTLGAVRFENLPPPLLRGPPCA
jgi:hypothetical protein